MMKKNQFIESVKDDTSSPFYVVVMIDDHSSMRRRKIFETCLASDIFIGAMLLEYEANKISINVDQLIHKLISRFPQPFIVHSTQSIDRLTPVFNLANVRDMSGKLELLLRRKGGQAIYDSKSLSAIYQDSDPERAFKKKIALVKVLIDRGFSVRRQDIIGGIAVS